MTTLEATLRPLSGKGEARKLRARGQTPAVVYGPENEPVPVAVDPASLGAIFKETQNRNTVIELSLDGETVPVLVREVQRHPVSRDILHVDFYRLSPERPVEVMVPVRPVGRPRGAQLGGRLRLIRRVIRARSAYSAIPADLPVDVSHMWIGDMMKASEIPVPEGVELLLENDFNVITVYGKRVGAPVEPTFEAAAEGDEAEGGEAEGEEAPAE